jgi:hypothetical protein
MTLTTRAQLHPDLLPTTTPVAPAQPGSLEQMFAYAARGLQAHLPQQSVSILLPDSTIQRYSLISVGEGRTTDNQFALVIQGVILFNDGRITGDKAEWAYAQEYSGSAALGAAYRQ